MKAKSTNSKGGKAAAEQTVKNIRRATRKVYGVSLISQFKFPDICHGQSRQLPTEKGPLNNPVDAHSLIKLKKTCYSELTGKRLTSGPCENWNRDRGELGVGYSRLETSLS